MTDRSFHILASPGFVLGLLLLLFNDFAFKEQFHNGFTGKLSDFAGLFVFPLFWSAFFPRRKTLIYVSTAALFVFWKSVYSQFLIEGWNSLPFFGIERTVDYTDLWALLILPLSYSYSNISSAVHVPNRLLHVIALVSLVAFTATQYSQKFSYSNQYEFQISRKELLDRISKLPKDGVTEFFWKEKGVFTVRFAPCRSSATVTLEEREKPSVITLNEIDYSCATTSEKDETRQYFEKEFIDRLREEPVRKSDQILDISPSSRP